MWAASLRTGMMMLTRMGNPFPELFELPFPLGGGGLGGRGSTRQGRTPKPLPPAPLPEAGRGEKTHRRRYSPTTFSPVRTSVTTSNHNDSRPR